MRNTSIIIDGIEYAGIIYKITNKINGMVYIGQTTRPRGFNGRYLAKGKGVERVYWHHLHYKQTGHYYNDRLLKSIEKHGFDAFEVDEVHDVAMTQEELNQKEIYYIEKYDSFNNGYNHTYGGDNYPSGSKCKNSKPVCQLSLDGDLIKIWPNALEASESLGINKAAIPQVCNGKMKTSGGFIWVFEKYYNEKEDYKSMAKHLQSGIPKLPVYLLDDNGNIIQEFSSCKEVEEKLDISQQTAINICRNIYKKRKYNLVFKSEYLEEQRLNMEGSYDAS